tara:strand:- start:209 stop:448 length:240 start_codon:yes stop_codon:yes gene_type:complete
MEYFNYVHDDFIPCEVCKCKAVDIHHLERRGMGGSKTKDYIENLVALCRICHDICEQSPVFNNKVKLIHEANVKYNQIH